MSPLSCVPVCTITALHGTAPQGEEGEKGEAPGMLFALPLIESGLGSRARKLQALARRI